MYLILKYVGLGLLLPADFETGNSDKNTLLAAKDQNFPSLQDLTRKLNYVLSQIGRKNLPVEAIMKHSGKNDRTRALFTVNERGGKQAESFLTNSILADLNLSWGHLCELIESNKDQEVRVFLIMQQIKKLENYLDWCEKRKQPGESVELLVAVLSAYQVLHSAMTIVFFPWLEDRDFEQALKRLPQQQEGGLFELNFPELAAIFRNCAAQNRLADTIEKIEMFDSWLTSTIEIWDGENGYAQKQLRRLLSAEQAQVEDLWLLPKIVDRLNLDNGISYDLIQMDLPALEQLKRHVNKQLKSGAEKALYLASLTGWLATCLETNERAAVENTSRRFYVWLRSLQSSEKNGVTAPTAAHLNIVDAAEKDQSWMYLEEIQKLIGKGERACRNWINKHNKNNTLNHKIRERKMGLCKQCYKPDIIACLSAEQKKQMART